MYVTTLYFCCRLSVVVGCCILVVVFGVCSLLAAAFQLRTAFMSSCMFVWSACLRDPWNRIGAAAFRDWFDALSEKIE